MNSSPYAIASRHGYKKTIPERRFRRGVGVCCPVSGTRPRGRPSARARTARGLQRAEVDREDRLCRGATCPTTCLRGRRSTSKRGDGSKRVSSRRWSTTCACSCGFRRPEPEPTAAILDSRTLRSTPESGPRGGYDGHKGKKGSKVHAAVDTLGQLLALRVSPANEDDREEVKNSPRRYSKRPGRTSSSLTSIKDTRARASGARRRTWHPARSGQAQGGQARLRLLPRRWVVERDFAWASRFRRLVKDYERLPETVAGLHFVAFACLFLQQAAGILVAGS